MPDFDSAWSLSRKRFLDETSGLSSNQLNWRLHPGSLSIGEMALHIAGVEVYFGAQLKELRLDEFGLRIQFAATEGVVNETPFPFPPDEIDPELVAAALEYSRKIWEPVITSADAAIRQKQIKSALGPIITGDGAFARLSFHAAYHQGQAYLMKTHPEFPEG